MATCPQCYTGTCKRHKRQDHGRSLVTSANAESTLQKMYDQLVGSKLQKLQAEAERDPSRQHTQEFRKKLDASRDKSLRKSHKSRAKLDVTGSGLNPQALAAICGDSEEERKSNKRHKKHAKKRKRRRESESSEDSDESYHRRKHKKSHKKKHKRSRTDSQ